MVKKKLKRKVRGKYKYTLVKNNDKSYRKRLGIYFSFNFLDLLFSLNYFSMLFSYTFICDICLHYDDLCT